MGFKQEQVDSCAAAIESSGEEMTVPNMLKALADCERAAAAARSPMYARAAAASERPAAKAAADEAKGGAKGSENGEGESVCCICLDGFENNKALFITECGHKYHFNCIRKYCEKGKEAAPSCPLCRQHMPTPPGQSKRSERYGAFSLPERAAPFPSRCCCDSAVNPRPPNSWLCLLQAGLSRSARRTRGCPRPARGTAQRQQRPRPSGRHRGIRAA